MDKSLKLREEICYMALAVSILANCLPEQAFEKLDPQHARIGSNGGRPSTLTDMDTEDMIRMRQQGLAYKEIGEIYGINASAAHHRIDRYIKKSGKDHNIIKNYRKITGSA